MANPELSRRPGARAHEIVALRTALKADPALEQALRTMIADYVRARNIPLSDGLAAVLVLAIPTETEAMPLAAVPAG